MNRTRHLMLSTAVALAAAHASAATHCVNPAGTGGCFASIAAAIAASAPSGDTISVGAGTYFESSVLVDRSVNIAGAGADITVVDGTGHGPQQAVFRFPEFFNPQVTMTFSELTIRNGYRGVHVGRFNHVTFDAVRITGNGPGSGAGIFNNASVLVVNDSTIDGNHAADNFFGCDWSGGSGGGIGSLCGGGSNYISNSTIANNTATSWGGGLIVNDGQTIIENSTLSGNSALHPDPNLGGGAIFVGGGSPDVAIRYSTVANNSAVGAGGGLWGADDGGTVRFKVLGSLVQDNTPDDCLDQPFLGPNRIKSLGYNVASDASCAFAQAGDAVSTDAMLGPLQDNGGPTQTHGFTGPSPAIDRIAAADCTVAADQRGVARPQGAGCDSGSVEATAADQLDALASGVEGVGPGGSLAGKVEEALALLAAGDTAGACQVLKALMNQVRAQTGKQLTAAQAAAIAASVQQIRAAAGCGS